MARAGLGSYLKSAFLTRWNLLLLFGAATAAALSPWPDAFLPLVAAGELSYLVGLVSRPRFRDAVDARVAASGRRTVSSGAAPTLTSLVAGLSVSGRERFGKLRARCIEMQRIAEGAQGSVQDEGAGESLRAPGLDKLLWMFLRLLAARESLERFLESTDEAHLQERVRVTRERLETATAAGDERATTSLTDSVAVSELRLDNYRKAVGNAEFMDIELDRIEQKIRALAEMSVIRQDPDYLTSQVDAAAESLQHTETAIRELQSITGLTDVLRDAPPILDADLRETLGHEA